MAEAFESCDQAPAISDELVAAAGHIANVLRGRLLDICLTVERGGVVIGGRTGSYYVKQLAQHAVMSCVSLPIAANDIEVVWAKVGGGAVARGNRAAAAHDFSETACSGATY